MNVISRAVTKGFCEGNDQLEVWHLVESQWFHCHGATYQIGMAIGLWPVAVWWLY